MAEPAGAGHVLTGSAYLEKRRARMLSNELFLHSLGFVGEPLPRVPEADGQPEEVAALHAEQPPPQTPPSIKAQELVKPPVQETPPAKRGRRAHTHEEPVIVVDGVEIPVERRRSTRKHVPVSLMMHEDWSRQAAMLRQNAQRRNCNAQLSLHTNSTCSELVKEIEKGSLAMLSWSVFSNITSSSMVESADLYCSLLDLDEQPAMNDDQGDDGNSEEEQARHGETNEDEAEEENDADDDDDNVAAEEERREEAKAEEKGDEPCGFGKGSPKEEAGNAEFRVIPKRTLMETARQGSTFARFRFPALDLQQRIAHARRAHRARGKEVILPEQPDFSIMIINEDKAEEQHYYDLGSCMRILPSATMRLPGLRTTGLCEVVMPRWLPPGNYRIEMTSKRKHIVCSTEVFNVTEAIGNTSMASVGVWCVCGRTNSNGQDYAGMWVSCSRCNAWQHWSCYVQRRAANLRVKSAHSDDEDDEEEDEGEDMFGNGGGGASAAAAANALAIPSTTHSTTTSTSTTNTTTAAQDIKVKPQRESRKVRQERTEQLATRVLHSHLLVPEVLPSPEDDFCCWACQPLVHLSDEHDNAEKEAHYSSLGDRVELMVNMIQAASNGYYRKYSPGEAQLLCVTPVHVVKFLRTLLHPGETKCMDLGAGSGSLSGALPSGSTCVEIDTTRFRLGKTNAPQLEWLNEDVLNPAFFRDPRHRGKHLIISNPDFEVALQFICVALSLIRNSSLTARIETPEAAARDGRIIMLLPTDFFEASGFRSRLFQLLDFRIETEYKLGHLCFYTGDGKMGQKLSCDSLFVLKPGRGVNTQKYEHKVVNARLAGML